MCSLVTSFFLFACESWNLTAGVQRGIQVEMRCYCRILRISYKDHVTNEEVRVKINRTIGPHEDLLTIIKRRKLQWYGHVYSSSGLAKTILQGTVKGRRRQGRQGRRWEDNIREWTGLEFAKSRGQWRTGKMEESGCEIICGAPTILPVKRWMRWWDEEQKLGLWTHRWGRSSTTLWRTSSLQRQTSESSEVPSRQTTKRGHVATDVWILIKTPQLNQ